MTVKTDPIPTTQEDRDLLVTALKRFEKLHTDDNHNREAALDDLRFVYNVDHGQWPDKIYNDRNSEDRPCLTSNKLRKFVAQVANRERDQRFAGNVLPVDNEADVDTAKIISGIIRQIEHASVAEVIYTVAGEFAIASGAGYWRITAEALPNSFEQELFIRPIVNQLAVYLDPEGMFGFIRQKLTKEEFEFQYPNALPEDFESGHELWEDGDNVFIAEYYRKERVRKLIAEVVSLSGEVSIVELEGDGDKQALLDNGFAILREKNPDVFKVKWAKITSTQILETGDWLGDEIPIIAVEGDWKNIDGRLYKRSLIADGKDPQRAYNFWLTNMAETVALAPKSPWLVSPQMIKGFKDKFWNVAHKKLLPYLPYNGKIPPRRESPPQVPTGAAQMLQISASDISDSIGLFEASFGEKSNERTGVAIQQRAGRSDFSTFHFPDNFRRALLASTRQLIDLVPKIYDTDRIVRILGEETDIEVDVQGNEVPQNNVVRINETVINPETGEKEIINDISVGKYDVVEDVKLMSTRRQEALAGMIEFARGAPNIAPIVLPEIAKMQDWPNAKKVTKLVEDNLQALLGTNAQQGAETLPGG